MQSQIDKRELRDVAIRPKFTRIGEDKIIGSAEWFDASMTRHERHVVLTIRGEQIADMQVCGSWRAAKRFANRDSPRR